MASKAERGCRTCDFLGVEPDKSGRIVPRKDNAYPCVVKVPKPDLPASMTFGWQGLKWPPHKVHMSPGMGVGCPCWGKRRRAS